MWYESISVLNQIKGFFYKANGGNGDCTPEMIDFLRQPGKGGGGYFCVIALGETHISRKHSPSLGTIFSDQLELTIYET